MNAASSSLSRREMLFGRGLRQAATSVSPARFLGPGSHEATGFTASDRASRRMPDCLVRTHREESLRWVSDLVSDQRVILSFIYTRCDGICPTTTRNMAAAYRILKERKSAPFRMISLSVDPARDTADDLARYAARYGLGGLPDWHFVVAGVEETLAIRKALRLTDPDPKRDGNLNNHSGLLVMGNDRTDPGVVRRAIEFYEAIGKITIEVKREVPGHVANRLQAALWREAISLVTEGVASVADVDKAVSAGPGIRWAVMGPTTLFHLGGGDGGLEKYLHQFKDSYHRWWDDLGNPRFTPETIEQLASGVAEATAGRSLADLAATRDRIVTEIIASRRRHLDQ